MSSLAKVKQDRIGYDGRQASHQHLHVDSTMKPRVALFVAVFSAIVCADNVPDAACMRRICEAASGCNLHEQCHIDRLGGRREGKYCGPYHISRPYWGMAGNKGTQQRYMRCVLNKTCAERTIRNFMRRQGVDCDRNGVIDCNDFAQIHKFRCASRSS